MSRGLPIITALLLVAAGVAEAQTINGESNYEDGISHIPPAPAPDEPVKAKPPADAAGQRGQLPKTGDTGSK